MKKIQGFHLRLRLGIVSLVLSAAMLGSATRSVASTPTVSEILTHFGFGPDDVRELKAGEVISNALDEASDKELAVVVVMWVDATPDRIVEAVVTGVTLEVNRDILQVQELLHDQSSDGLAKLALSKAEKEEASKLLRASAGSTYNLSKSEIDQLKATAGHLSSSQGAGREDPLRAANQTYQSILTDRLQAYQQSGVRGIAPYGRGGGKRALPNQELSGAAAAETLLAEKNPEFHKAFADYPRNSTNHINHRFYGFKQRVEERPCIILAHRLFEQNADHALMAERQFYVGHTYNSLQIVAGCFPVEKGTVVFYTNRTSTDQVAGFGSSLKHKIGRGRMRDEVVTHFQTVRRAIEEQ